MRTAYETRSAVAPYETRDEGDPGLDAATRAVEELRTAVEQGRAAIETRLTAELATLATRLDAIDVRTQRPGGPGIIPPDAERRELECRAFTGFLRHGREALSAEEVRSLIVGDDTRGGYLAPPEFVAEVIKNLVQYSPVRQAARVGMTAGGSVRLPKRTAAPTANWVGETETRPEAAPTYGQIEIPVHEAACYVDVSSTLLEDAAVNVEAEVSTDLAEEFGRLEGVAFVTGDGVKRPTGFMSDANIDFTLSGAATAVTADSLIDLFYSLAAFYRMNATWMMNGTSLASVRKLKDGEGNYLWRPGLEAGQPETILGRPVVEAVDMPDIGAGTYPIAFGDFNSAYRIYDRVALSVLRDPYTVATSGLVRFHARRRVGGGTVKAEAIKKLKIGTS